MSSGKMSKSLLPEARPLAPPIFHASTYAVDTCDQFEKLAFENGYFYSRHGTPSSNAAEQAIGVFEGGVGTIVFTSGMAAISTALMTVCKPGDHIVMNSPVYSGTQRFALNILAKYGVTTSFVPAGCSVEQYRNKVQANTKVLYGETPCNPNMAILDLEQFGALGRSLQSSHPDLLTIVDSTFASPYLQQPLKYGVDIVAHSCTKYLGGHNDLLAGSLTVNSEKLLNILRKAQETLGNPLSAFDSSLLHRGVQTLQVRMDKHSQNGMVIAEFLESHPKILKVHYPGLPSHNGHDVAKKQMTGFGGMVSFETKGTLEQSVKFVESLNTIKLAVSLGGVQSTIEHVTRMTHMPHFLPQVENKDEIMELPPTLIRFSVGIEDPEILKQDLDQALSGIQI